MTNLHGMQFRTWTETEIQGRGRRYWFHTTKDAVDFHTRKRSAGYRAVYDGNGSRTVWVPFGKTLTPDIQRQEAGMDPEEN